jgi:hypothetical protein
MNALEPSLELTDEDRKRLLAQGVPQEHIARLKKPNARQQQLLDCLATGNADLWDEILKNEEHICFCDLFITQNMMTNFYDKTQNLMFEKQFVFTRCIFNESLYIGILETENKNYKRKILAFFCIYFIECFFLNGFNINKSFFSYNLSFYKCNFKFGLVISNSIIRSINIEDSIICQVFLIENPNVSESILIKRSTIGCNFTVKDATYIKNFAIHESEISGHSIFTKNKIGKYALFKCLFKSPISYSNIFFEEFYYGFTIIDYPTEFVKCAFYRIIEFSSCHFKSTVSFRNSIWGKLPDFRNASFAKVPDGSNFDDIRAQLNGEPSPVRKKLAISNESEKFFTAEQIANFPKLEWENDPQAADKLRALRQLAKQTEDHEREQDYFAFELEAKALLRWDRNDIMGSLGRLGRSIPTFCFWLLGDYGRSIFIPLVWWLIVFLQSSYELMTQKVCSAIADHPFKFTFSSMMPVPGIANNLRSNLLDECKNRDLSFIYSVGFTSGIVSAVLIFLFLLALRNRFRM